GYAHGDVYGVQVTKKDEAGKALAGAEFTLYDEDGVTIVQKATSDANGIASFSNLIKEHYLIKETKAPEGYQLSDEEIQVNAAQLKNYGSGIIYKDFTNRKA
ncbi:prealbumin-like fold domain-containing protein, partial [Streptococcus pneumoniae]|nr:prealbumin-like fold domain-containing protein [Streptococcus pneumoniae]